jgi:glutathione S-transferase
MIMPPVNIIIVETILLPKEHRNQVNVERAVKLLSRMLGAVDAGLEGRDFMAGAFSGADIMTGHACTVAQRLGADVSEKPNLAAYIARLNARPAMHRAWAAT